MILLISWVLSMSEINKSIAHKWELRVNFEPAVELLYNSEIRIELLNREKNSAINL